MGYDVLLLARAELTPAQLKRWRQLQVRGELAALAACAEGLDPGALPPARVTRVLKDTKRAARPGPWHERMEPGRVELIAILPEHVYVEHVPRLAAAFRGVGKLGGRARFDVLGYFGGPAGFGFDVNPEGVQLHRHTPLELERLRSTGVVEALEAGEADASAAPPELPDDWLERIGAAATKSPTAADAFDEDAIVSGWLRFPPRKQSAWLRKRLDPSALQPAPCASEATGEVYSANDVLMATMDHLAPSAGAVPAGAVGIAGALPARELRRWGNLLVAAWLSAASYGAEGELRLHALASEERGVAFSVADGALEPRTLAEADTGDALHQEAKRTAATMAASGVFR